MKKLLTITLMLTLAVLSVSAEDATANLIERVLNNAVNRFENYSFEEYEKPETLDLKPIELNKQKALTKQEIVADMNYMWYRLIGDDDTVVLIEDISEMEFDYSGEKLYVLFSDEMFDSPRWVNTVAYYATRKDERMFPTAPKYKDGVFPLIVIRSSTTLLSRDIYYEYMRDVLAHEMLHYALERYEDFNISHQHDDVFLSFAKGWSAELADLNIDIKPYASQYELELLIK